MQVSDARQDVAGLPVVRDRPASPPRADAEERVVAHHQPPRLPHRHAVARGLVGRIEGRAGPFPHRVRRHEPRDDERAGRARRRFWAGEKDEDENRRRPRPRYAFRVRERAIASVPSAATPPSRRRDVRGSSGESARARRKRTKSIRRPAYVMWTERPAREPRVESAAARRNSTKPRRAR